VGRKRFNVIRLNTTANLPALNAGVYIPFEYGYGSFYEQKTREVLVEMGLIGNVSFYDLRESGVILRSHKDSKCKKSEVKQFGNK